MCGLGAEIAQSINELAFDELDAPPGRLHTTPVSHPFAPVLERAMLVTPERIAEAVLGVIDGRPPVPDHWRGQGRSAPAAPTPVASEGAKPAAAPAPAPAPVAMAEEPGTDEPIKMPFGDLTVSEGKLIGWLRGVGDRVQAGDVVAEIETDKAVVEIEAPVSGTLSRIDVEVGAMVPMGGRIGGISP
jgi:2-oxoisovalerate dehydrogenase E1 component